MAYRSTLTAAICFFVPWFSSSLLRAGGVCAPGPNGEATTSVFNFSTGRQDCISTTTVGGGGGGGGGGTPVWGFLATSSGAVTQTGLTTTPAKLSIFTSSATGTSTIPDVNNAQITVSSAGAYSVFSNIYSTGSGSFTYYFRIRVNGSDTSPSLTCSDSPSARCSMQGLLNLSTGDVVTVYGSVSSGTQQLTVNDAQLGVFLIGALGSGGGSTPGLPLNSYQYNSGGSLAGNANILQSGNAVVASNAQSIVQDQINSINLDNMTSVVIGNGVVIDLSTAIFFAPNGTAVINSDCNSDAQRGRIFIATSAATGHQFYACEGTLGWVLQGSNSSSGASSLAVTTGAVSGFSSVTSSPTAVIVFDSSTISVQLTGSATAFVSLNPLPIPPISATFDGGGVSITVPSTATVMVPYDCTVSTWNIVQATGSITVDVRRTSYSNYTGTTTSIVGGGTAPFVNTDVKNRAQPASWTSTTLNAGDVLDFIVTAVTGTVKSYIQLFVKKR